MKVIFVFLTILLLCSGNFYPEQIADEIEIPLYFKIGFVKKRIYRTLIYPRDLFVGIEINKETFYKLEYRGIIISGSLLNSGLNFVNFMVNDLFEKSATHNFFLYLKRGNVVQKKEIEIDIVLNPPAVEKSETFNFIIEKEIKLGHKTFPMNPVDGSYPILESVNLVKVAKRIIKKIKKRKREKQKKMELKDQINMIFFKESGITKREKIEASVRIKIKS